MKTPEQILVIERGHEPLTDTVETNTAIKAMKAYGNQCYLQGMKLPQGLMSQDVYSETAMISAYNKGQSDAETVIQHWKDRYKKLNALVHQYRMKFIPEHPNRKEFDEHFGL
jgi:hypothetical protein